MSLTKLIAVGLAEVLDLPLVEALCAPELIKPLKDHFTQSADALGKSLQGCYSRALYGIALGIAPSALDPKQLLAARVAKDLGRRVEERYLLPYAEDQQLDEQGRKDLRRRAVRLCDKAAKSVKTVLPRGDIPEFDLAELFQDARQGALGALVIERMQDTAALAPHLDQDILDLLAYEDLLGQALLYFLREDLRRDKRVQATLQALQQAGVWGDVQALQAAQTSLAAGLESQQARLSEQLAAHQEQIIALVQAGRFTDMAPLQAQAAILQGQLETINERTAALPGLLADLKRRLDRREADFAGLRELNARGIDEIQAGLAAMEQRLAEVLTGIDDGVQRMMAMATRHCHRHNVGYSIGCAIGGVRAQTRLACHPM